MIADATNDVFSRLAGPRPVPVSPPLYRKLGPADATAVAAHFLRLDPGERRMRFCGSTSDDSVRAHAAQLPGPDAFALGCFVQGELHALAELRILAGTWPREAEFALTVDRSHQGLGVGTELLRRTLVMARNRSVQALVMMCLPENLRMRTIARKFGARLQVEDGEVLARLPAVWPSPTSLAEELSWDGIAAVRTAVGS